MPISPFTLEDLERVRVAAAILADKAPKLVGEHPLFAVAALSMALAQAAILTDTSWETLQELLGLHYESCSVSVVARDLNDAGSKVVAGLKPEGKS